ncbi:hypothetical protein PIROE2DRAFT_64705 [Piromyces sp. E2]|nr:hypothetical protein PIROE2DRAFT_64705 [Piromyces sp. E2]|eukprot:OUM57959.1 hypothetical protein PIROE2DRAFT_64705 [Piromyces sp. E2]
MIKQQHMQQNNLLNNKSPYYRNLSNIIENQELNKTINTYDNSNNLGIQTNNIYNTNFETSNTNSYLSSNQENLILQQQQQQQQQRHYLKNSLSTPNIQLNNNIINGNMYKTINNPYNSLTNIDTTNIPNINSNMTPLTNSLTNDELINNYEQLLNLYNVQIKRLQLQLLQQQKQIELNNMMDSPLLGQDKINLYSNSINNTLNPNLYSVTDSLTNSTTIPQNKLFNNNFVDNGNGYSFNGNLGHAQTGFVNNPNLGIATSNMNNLSLAMKNNNIAAADSANNSTSQKVNYIPGMNNLGNISQSNGINNTAAIGTAVSNDQTLSSLENQIGTDDSTQLIFNSSSVDPTTINDLNQTNNPFNIDSLNGRNITDNFANSNLSNLDDIQPPTVVTTTTDLNDQSIDNAKNLFLEVIKDFDENEIQDIVHNSNIEYIIN